MKKVKVIVYRVGAAPADEEVEPELDNLQALVGGDIELVPIPELQNNRVAIYVNENGVTLNLPQNRPAPEGVLAVGGWLRGDFFVMATGSSGDARSLRSQEIARVLRLLEKETER